MCVHMCVNVFSCVFTCMFTFVHCVHISKLPLDAPFPTGLGSQLHQRLRAQLPHLLDSSEGQARPTTRCPTTSKALSWGCVSWGANEGGLTSTPRQIVPRNSDVQAPAEYQLGTN